MSKPLAGKVALVTGASRGIGRATAKRLAADGAFVVVHYGQATADADQTVADIKAAGGDAVAVSADLADAAAIVPLFERIDAALTQHRGSTRIDILVNNAGIAPMVPFADTDIATLDKILAVNARGLFLVTQAALTRLADGGRIVSVSSAVTRIAFPGISAYSASKGFVDVLTLHLAAELGVRNITVNAVAPGVISTDMSQFVRSDEGAALVHSMQALKRTGQPEDVASVVAFLAGPDGAWVTGRVIDVSGGTKL